MGRFHGHPISHVSLIAASVALHFTTGQQSALCLSSAVVSTRFAINPCEHQAPLDSPSFQSLNLSLVRSACQQLFSAGIH